MSARKSEQKPISCELTVAREIEIFYVAVIIEGANRSIDFNTIARTPTVMLTVS